MPDNSASIDFDADLEPDDFFSADTVPDPLQVAIRLHEMRQARGLTGSWESLSPDDRFVAVMIAAAYLRNLPQDGAADARAPVEALRESGISLGSGVVLESVGGGDRDVDLAMSQDLVDVLVLEGALHG